MYVCIILYMFVFTCGLMCSGSTDQSVVLWRIASCSSAPWLGSDVLDGGDDEDIRNNNRTREDVEDDIMLSSIIGGGVITDSNDPPDVKV